MSIKHTPGPWTIEPDSMFGYKVLGTKQDGAWPIMFQGDLPNARLIAAAPELLEALRFLLSKVEDMSGYWTEDTDHAVSDAQKAIAKAEDKL